MKLNRRLELRASQSDLERWRIASRHSGHASVADWIRGVLNERACPFEFPAPPRAAEPVEFVK